MTHSGADAWRTLCGKFVQERIGTNLRLAELELALDVISLELLTARNCSWMLLGNHLQLANDKVFAFQLLHQSLLRLLEHERATRAIVGQIRQPRVPDILGEKRT